MLSPSSRPYIEASIPVLQEHGVTITQRFYHGMFTAHPELRNLFNMGNQANGSQQQSLAAAVFAYAANIDNATALAPVIERICHKHASVGIKPEHYPIVGRHLLQAIADTLGNTATAGLMQAWDEAYWLLAGELIATEARLYQSRGVSAGAMQQVMVSRVENETKDTISLYLQTKNQTSPGTFQPGQYISVLAHFDQHPEKQFRQYSLSDAIQQPWWRITIKREMGNTLNETPKGRVSNWLHEHVRMGDELTISSAYGDFSPNLESKKPLVLLAAGVGITPMQSIINTLSMKGCERPIWFGYAAKTSAHHVFKTELSRVRTTLPQLQFFPFYEDQTGRMELETHTLPLDGEYYICGPHAFMRAQWASLLGCGIHSSQIHREVFGPELLDHLLEVR